MEGQCQSSLSRIESSKILNVNETMTLFRPVGPKELELIRASGNRAFPPRLPEQPIFYPVLDEEYAIQIARDWNAKDSRNSAHRTNSTFGTMPIR